MTEAQWEEWMTEAQWEEWAAQTRQKLLKIWDGDAESSDKWMCFIMQYLRDALAAQPPDKRNPAVEQKLMQRLAMMIHR